MSYAASISGAFSESKMLKNTFALLGATFLFSALMAYVAMALAVPFLGPWVTLGVYIAILVGLHFTQNSGWGVLMTFALTGWLGFTLGPVLTAVLAVNPGIVLNAFCLTALMFGGLSGYALATRKNFSYLSGFLFAGILVAFVAGLVAIFFQLPLLSLAVSVAFVILSSALILWQISEIVNGGETNYVMATVTLFVSIYNIFTGLLHIFGFSQD